jgi:hypothetical protein
MGSTVVVMQVLEAVLTGNTSTFTYMQLLRTPVQRHVCNTDVSLPHTSVLQSSSPSLVRITVLLRQPKLSSHEALEV